MVESIYSIQTFDKCYFCKQKRWVKLCKIEDVIDGYIYNEKVCEECMVVESI